MPKVYDVTTCFNELMLLDLRMSILNDSVDYFIINEAPLTFSGKPKPLFFWENRDKFTKFAHKIIHNVYEEEKEGWDQWDRDKNHKNGAMQALEGVANDDDVIIYSDCDEILESSVVDFSKTKNDTLYIAMQRCFYYYLNTEWREKGKSELTWRGSRYSTYGFLKQHSFDAFRSYDGYFYQNQLFKKEYIPNAGYHFSFLGGQENIKYKISSYGHIEMNVPIIRDNLQNNINMLRDPFFRPNFEIIPIPISIETHPKYLIDHIDEYQEYIYN
jgi:beta-1,4-mannosyl-glycoprotein beta-1,4-N-acetylglucosaminyltransferase